MYSWSVPRSLIESSLPKRIPIPIKIQAVFEPKDTVIFIYFLLSLFFERILNLLKQWHLLFLWCCWIMMIDDVQNLYSLSTVYLFPSQGFKKCSYLELTFLSLVWNRRFVDLFCPWKCVVGLSILVRLSFLIIHLWISFIYGYSFESSCHSL